MSRICHMLLHIADYENERLAAELSDWLAAEGFGSLACLGTSGAWGGWKEPGDLLYGGVLNHADLGRVVDQVGAMPWVEARFVQLMLCDQEDWYFQIWMNVDGVMAQVAPDHGLGAVEKARRPINP